MATFLSDEEQLRAQIDELAQSEEFQRRLEGISKSRLWRHITEFLCVRREQLFMEKVSGADARAFRDGALTEVQRLLSFGPKLVLQHEMYRKKDQQPRPQASEPRVSPTDDGLG